MITNILVIVKDSYCNIVQQLIAVNWEFVKTYCIEVIYYGWKSISIMKYSLWNTIIVIVFIVVVDVAAGGWFKLP